jgi:uncharacterized membrane protein
MSGEWNKLLVRIQGSPLKVKMLPAVLCYALIVFSWYYFIYSEHRVHRNVLRSVKTAFILGFVIYGIYELTNAAIINKWGWKYVIMDTLWGGILYALVTYIALKFGQ